MSQNRIVIAGTIASGKSTLSELLREKGYPVIDSDKVNADLLKEGEANYLAIKNSGAFDQAFSGKTLSKEKLGKIIFSSPEKRELLNSLTHKNIVDEIENRLASCGSPLVFVEIPLYFSMKEKFENDGVRLVEADREVQIKRLMERDGIERTYAEKKLESSDRKVKMEKGSDHIFDNSEDLDHLKKQVDLALDEIDLIQDEADLIQDEANLFQDEGNRTHNEKNLKKKEVEKK